MLKREKQGIACESLESLQSALREFIANNPSNHPDKQMEIESVFLALSAVMQYARHEDSAALGASRALLAFIDSRMNVQTRYEPSAVAS